MQTNSNIILATVTLPYVTIHLVGEPTAETVKAVSDLPDYRLNYYNKATGEDIFFYIKTMDKQPIGHSPENIIPALGEAVHKMVSDYAKSYLNMDVERTVMSRTGRSLYIDVKGPSDEEVQRDRNEAIHNWNNELFSNLYKTHRRHDSPMTLSGCQKNRNLRMSLGKNIMLFVNTELSSQRNEIPYYNPFGWGMTGKVYMFGELARFVVVYDNNNFGLSRFVPMDLSKILSREVVKTEIIQRVKMFFPFFDSTMQAQVLSDISFDEIFVRPENENVYE